MKGIATARMSSKGRLVIPQQVRTSLGLEAGSQFVVTAEEDLIVLKVLGPPQERDYAPLIKLARRQRSSRT